MIVVAEGHSTCCGSYGDYDEKNEFLGSFGLQINQP